MADLEEAAGDANAIARWPMRLVIIGIFLNLSFLIAATLVPDCEVSLGRSIALISASIGPYLIGLIALWYIASVKFSSITNQLSQLR